MMDSTQINNKAQYDVLMVRFEELALSIAESPPKHKGSDIYIEMGLLANAIEKYEDVHFPLD